MEEITEIFCSITSIKELEEEKGNTLDIAIIKIKYKENMIITERINIFGLIKGGSLYEYIKYFKNFKKKFSEQETDTKIKLDEYIKEEIEISQEIEIKMVFEMVSSIKDIEERSKTILEAINITSIDKKIWKLL